MACGEIYLEGKGASFGSSEPGTLVGVCMERRGGRSRGEGLVYEQGGGMAPEKT